MLVRVGFSSRFFLPVTWRKKRAGSGGERDDWWFLRKRGSLLLFFFSSQRLLFQREVRERKRKTSGKWTDRCWAEKEEKKR